ncbi:hypothetical protein EDEG_02933 [Edhazardia aedis USNM 41457]|uniref:Uncharacterized protein n=1 Tax=Edhazardia aedis (strain USNM 41457) TaxID=1003232 RepID=J9D4E8_EDHAE|nr:hypothetical protein EDEG_02933 [Edhazardia aedis USNM 41457]|eukprot:EJW02671.1 hypothetical protein EDEG_02933 [Edhazardia aedis USNM 41457]
MDNLKNQNFTIPENNTKNYFDPENIIVEYHFIETFDYHSFLKNFYAKKNTINSLDHIVSIENFMLWYLKMQITPIYTDLHNRIAKVFFLLFPEKNIIFQFAVDPFANPTDMKKSKASNEKKDQTIMTDSKEGNAKADTIITNDSIAANDQIKQNDTHQTVQEKAEGQKPKKKRKKYTENKAVQRETVESAQNTVEVVNVESSKDFEKDPDSMVDSVKDKNETVETPNMSVSESTKNTPDQIIVQNDDSKLPKEKKRNKPDITKDTKNKNKNYKLILRLFISGDPYKCQEFLNNSDDKLRGLDSKFVRHINIPERHPNTEKLKVYTGIIDAFKKEVATNNIKKSQPETEDRKQLL